MTEYSNAQHHDDRAIALWLIFVAILIYAMVILGGVTRLTGSGLSMVEWDPIMGVLPPFTEQEWQETFGKYKQFPEYQKKNLHMDLEGFKDIFVFEYAHRMLGRFIGLAFLIPFLFFLFKKRIRSELTPKLIIMFILGGLQGLLGWYMVKSGLVSDPHVSQYRLAAHLSAAILIYSYILWVAWGLLNPEPQNSWVRGIESLRRNVKIAALLIVIMILSGAFVAGTRAGHGFNTFPLMNGYFIPPGLFDMSPFYLNFFENPTTIQFNHRMIAYLLILYIPIVWYSSKKYTLIPHTRNAFHLLLFIFIVQVVLGITTLLYEVPVALGAAHQGGALLLLTVVLYVVHELRVGKSL
ncbi:MAG: COX15/CtaA family protein [Thioalkalispiraceae bacterium]